MIRSVAGVIFFKKKYLFQIRDNKPTIWFPGYNGFFGGLIDKKEKPEDAIKREIFEELNIKVLSCKLLIKFRFQTKKFKEERERYYYLLDLPKNFEKKMFLNEGAGYKFLSINKFKLNKMIPWDITATYYHQMLLKKINFIPK